MAWGENFRPVIQQGGWELPGQDSWTSSEDGGEHNYTGNLPFGRGKHWKHGTQSKGLRGIKHQSLPPEDDHSWVHLVLEHYRTTVVPWMKETQEPPWERTVCFIWLRWATADLCSCVECQCTYEHEKTSNIMCQVHHGRCVFLKNKIQRLFTFTNIQKRYSCGEK